MAFLTACGITVPARKNSWPAKPGFVGDVEERAHSGGLREAHTRRVREWQGVKVVFQEPATAHAMRAFLDGDGDLTAAIGMAGGIVHRPQSRGRVARVCPVVLGREGDRHQRRSASGAILGSIEAIGTQGMRHEVVCLITCRSAGALGPFAAHGT
jgi:hypothetical protein